MRKPRPKRVKCLPPDHSANKWQSKEHCYSFWHLCLCFLFFLSSHFRHAFMYHHLNPWHASISSGCSKDFSVQHLVCSSCGPWWGWRGQSCSFQFPVKEAKIWRIQRTWPRSQSHNKKQSLRLFTGKSEFCRESYRMNESFLLPVPSLKPGSTDKGKTVVEKVPTI